MFTTSNEPPGGPSTYATAAEVYRDQGLSVIPCAPGEKFPGHFAFGQWGPANDWDRFCDRLPKQLETELWDRWPGAGVCLALGRASAPKGKILVAIDIDTDEPLEVEAIKRALPGSPCAKRGRKGETQFYLANPCVVNRSYNDGNRRRLLDLLAHGRQTVMPPTLHPEGMRYTWITPDRLDSFDVADLPMLPDDIGDRLAETLRPFGYEMPPQLCAKGDGGFDGDKVHRALNDAALENLGAWVPVLGLHDLACSGDRYRAVATWRPSSSGQPLAKRKRSLSIAREGIRDFGDTDKGYTPLDLVKEAMGVSLDEAFRWLQDRVVSPKCVALLPPACPRKEPHSGNLVHLRLATFLGEPIADATLGREFVDEDDTEIEIARTRSVHIEDREPKYAPVDLWQHFEAPSIPPGLLPKVIDEFAFGLGEIMGADPAGLGMSALAVCGAAIPDAISLQVKRYDPTWRENARLWVALVGMPSTKKTPIMKAALKPLRRIDQEQAEINARLMNDYMAVPIKERAGRASPKQPRYVVEDATTESLQSVLMDSPHGVLSIQDELPGLFGRMDKYGGPGGAAADRAFWLQAFNGGAYSVHRVIRGSLLIPNLSIAMLGGIQPGPIRKIAGESVDDGLIQRFLPIVLRSASVGRDAPVGDVVAKYAEMVARLVKLRALSSGNLGASTPLNFSDGALEIRECLEREHASLISHLETLSPKLSAHLGKMDGIFARLCLAWHCIEHSYGDLPSEITEELAQRVAKFVTDFLRPNAVAFYAEILGMSGGHEELMALASVIVSERLTEVSARHVQRSAHALRHVTADDARRLCEKLDSFGWLEPIELSSRSKSPRWRVVPEVHSLFAERGRREKKRRADARAAYKKAFGS